MLSVNQMNAQIKRAKLWKASNDPEHQFGISQKVQVKNQGQPDLQVLDISQKLGKAEESRQPSSMME